MRSNFLSQVLQRLASKSPRFFRIVQYTLWALTAVSLAFVYLHSKSLLHFDDKQFEEGILSVCDDLWKFTCGGAVVAMTSTTNPDLVDTEVKQAVKQDEMN